MLFKRLNLATRVLVLVGLSTGLLGFQTQETPRETYLVRLTEPSVLERLLADRASGRLLSVRRGLKSTRAQDYRSVVEASQSRLIGILDPGVRVLSRKSILLNFLVVECSKEAAEQLQLLADVQAVYPNRKLYPMLDVAPRQIGAGAAWDLVGDPDSAGAGVRIGIIDTGIAEEHPMFDGEGFEAPEGFPNGDLENVNPKVIVARTYVLPEYGYKEQENQSAEDEGVNSHGTGIAGIAAGRWVESPQGRIRGIAPRAFLGNYKVFGTPGINDLASDAGGIAAIEDAVVDEMDVLNLSLGGPPDRPGAEDLYVEAIRLATEAGVLCVIAGGNTGPDSNTIESPGISPDALTVGSISHRRVLLPYLSIASDLSAVPFDLASFPYQPATPIPEQTGPLMITSLGAVDPDEEACLALPDGSLAGRVVLARSGNCSFQDQADHVFAAGAAGLVLYVATESLPETSLQSDGPVAVIGWRDGSLLRDLLENQGEVSIIFGAETDRLAFPDPTTESLSWFSSRGPSIDLLIKPDLLAPGESILTASKEVEPAPGFSNFSGTSFSTPLVAGAAAVFKGLHPEWGPRAIKSALVNTASPEVGSPGEVPRIMKTGNGKLNLAAAVDAQVTADPVSLSFGLWTNELGFEQSHTIGLSNHVAHQQDCEVQILESQSNSSVEFATDSPTFSLGNGDSYDLVATAASDDPQPGPFEGRLLIDCGDETPSLTLPYWGVVVAAGPVLLRVAQDGSADVTSVEIALEVAGPGSIIEIKDSETYAANLNIGRNIEGVRLDGLALRAAENSSPTIEAGGRAPAISVSQVEDILIEGLHIRGGRGGFSFLDATGVVRHNLIEENLYFFDDNAVDIRRSRVHVYDNVIRDNGRDGAGVFVMDASAIVQGNEITGNGAEGVRSHRGIVSVFDNFISGNTQGAQIHLWESFGLVKGNEIRDSVGRGFRRGGGVTALILTEAWIQDNWIAGNRGHGVALFREATAGLLRNEISQNQEAGLLLQSGSSAQLFSGKLLGNGVGISVVDSELLVKDSVVAQSTLKGDGSGLVLRGGIVEGYNVTVFGNAGFGLDLEGEATIANSVFFGNLSGDLGSFPPGSVLNSLIGDGQLDGMDDNFADDPLLNDPAGGDFSLLPGSPAIDRGSDTFPAGAADLDGHQRVVDGDLNGTEVIDLGAAEFGSGFASALVVPILSAAGLDFAGLAITNTFHKTAQVKVRTYPALGSPAGALDELELELEPLTQYSVLIEDLPGGMTAGWLEVLSTEPDSIAITLGGDQRLQMMDGIGLARPVVSPLWFAEIHSGDSSETRLLLINPEDESVEVALTWHGPDGKDIKQHLSIESKGMIQDTVETLFGTKSGLEDGYVSARVEETEGGPDDPKLFGLQLFGTSESQAALPALEAASADELILPHLYLGSGLVNHLSVINTGAAREIVLELMDKKGELVSVSQSNLDSGGFLQVDLAQLFQVDGNVDGWLRLSPGVDIVASHVVASETGSFLAALPLQAAGAREVVIGPVATTQDFFTGLGLLNNSEDGVLSTIELFDPAAGRLGVHFLTLEPGEKQSHVLFELMSILRDQPGGFVRIRSTSPIYTVGSLGAQRLNFLTLLPPHVLVE